MTFQTKVTNGDRIKIQFDLIWRWIESFPNGQSVTTEVRAESFDTIEEYESKIIELQKNHKPSKGMKLEYKGNKVITIISTLGNSG